MNLPSPGRVPLRGRLCPPSRSSLRRLPVIALAAAAVCAAVAPDVVPTADAAARRSGVTTILAPANSGTFTPTNRPYLRISGTATNAAPIDGVQVAVRNLASGRWRQDDGTFSSRWDYRRASGTTQWRLDLALPPGRYAIRARARRGRTFDAPDVTRLTVTGRDPLRWPYPSDSIWNTPRGSSARLIPFDMDAPAEKTLRAEDDLLFFSPSLPRTSWTNIAPHTSGWKKDGDRCHADWNAKVPLGGDTAFPMRPLATGQQYGIVPNHSTAIVMPDYTLRETQPMVQCSQGFASQYASGKWQGDSILTGGQGANATGSSGGGSHGGGFMTAFGGTIRLGEWVRGGNIPHATKIEVFSQMWLTRDTSRFRGYRWPALAADSGWASGYGTLAPRRRPAQAVMGALLTLPNSFDVDSRLRSEPARILARSIRDYGTYVVDGTGRDTVQIATEWSSEGRVYDQFQREFGYAFDGDASSEATPKNQFLTDMEVIYENLHIVDDNARGATGGSGPRMTWRAPALR